MARAKKIAPSSVARGYVRQLLAAGNSRLQVSDAVNQRFGNLNQNLLNSMIRQETNRQANVDAIMNRDKRRTVDLRRIVRCPKGTTIQASINVVFDDTVTGRRIDFWENVTLRESGRLATILNEALSTVLADAIARGYTPPTITSAQTSGSAKYRINYVECT